MSHSKIYLLIIIGTIGITLFDCTKKADQQEKTQQNISVENYISSFEQKAKEFEEPATAAIKILIDSMGSDVELFKTKDFSQLKGLAEQARQTCLEATMGFRQISITIPESLPDTVRFSMTTVSTLLQGAYKSRTDAMHCAVLLFTDSLEIHLTDFSNNLKAAKQQSNQAGLGLQTLRKWLETSR